MMLAEADVPKTREDLIRALEDLHAQSLALVDAYFSAMEPDGPAEPISKPALKRPYVPRSALYRLALDAMRAFVSEEGRYPTIEELLDTMPVYDDGLSPINVRIDRERKIIHWKDWKGRAKKTGLRSFANKMPHLRAEVHRLITVANGAGAG